MVCSVGNQSLCKHQNAKTKNVIEELTNAKSIDIVFVESISEFVASPKPNLEDLLSLAPNQNDKL